MKPHKGPISKEVPDSAWFWKQNWSIITKKKKLFLLDAKWRKVTRFMYLATNLSPTISCLFGSQRVGHDLGTKPPLNHIGAFDSLYSFRKVGKCPREIIWESQSLAAEHAEAKKKKKLWAIANMQSNLNALTIYTIKWMLSASIQIAHFSSIIY